MVSPDNSTKLKRFIGLYYHALEQKGRLAIPKPFRDQFGKGGVITRGLEGCLFLFPSLRWEQMIEEVESQSVLKVTVREWVRLLAHNAQEVEFDDQGRILINEHLRGVASLEGECVIAGLLDRVEIWQRSRYHEYMESLEQRAEEVAERLAESKERGKKE